MYISTSGLFPTSAKILVLSLPSANEVGECNVFTGVCLFNHDALDLTVQDPLLPATDIWWLTLEICSNLFAWGPPSRVTSGVVVATEARTVCKRAIRILLECFLVDRYLCWWSRLDCLLSICTESFIWSRTSIPTGSFPRILTLRITLRPVRNTSQGTAHP